MKQFALITLFDRSSPEISLIISAETQDEAKKKAFKYFEEEYSEWSVTVLENDYQKDWYVLEVPEPAYSYSD